MFVFAGVLGAIYCLVEFAPAVSAHNRFRLWGVIMTGPMHATGTDAAFVRGIAPLGWCGLLLGLTHVCWPRTWTAVVAVIGWMLWFTSGWLTILVFTQAR